MITAIVEVEELLLTSEGARGVLQMLDGTELDALSLEERADLRRRAIAKIQSRPASQG